MEYFNITSSLYKVCTTLIDPEIKLPRSGGIELFCPVKPMLAGRLSVEKVPRAMRNQFCIEVKYDGERIQVHMKNGRVRLFTRRGNEYTTLYATGRQPTHTLTLLYFFPLFNFFFNLFPQKHFWFRMSCIFFLLLWLFFVAIPMIQRHFKNNIESAIMDGELLVYDRAQHAFEGFGHLKTFAKYDTKRQGGATPAEAAAAAKSVAHAVSVHDDERFMDELANESLMEHKQYCYVAFDLLYINGKVIN